MSDYRSKRDVFYGSTVQAGIKLITNKIDKIIGANDTIVIGGVATSVEINGDIIVSGTNNVDYLRTNDPNTNVLVSSGPPPGAGQLLVASINPSTALWGSLPSPGTGDVHGPASSSDDEIVRYDGTTGKLLKHDSTNATTLSSAGLYFGPTLVTTITKTNLGSGTSTPVGLGNTFIGYRAGLSATAIDNTTLVGDSAGLSLTSGTTNTFIGSSAGGLTTYTENTFVGEQAGAFNKNGIGNVLLGFTSGRGNAASVSDASNCTFIGANTGVINIADDNVFIGYNSGHDTVSGSNNTFIGSESGTHNSIGTHNVYVGDSSGKNINSEFNTCVGQGSGENLTTQTINTMVGFQSGMNSTGSHCVFLGNNAGKNNTTDNRLVIENTAENTYPLVDGTFATNVGKTNGVLKTNATTTLGNDNMQYHSINGLVTTTATAGGGATLPGIVSQYLIININGTQQKIPLFNT